MNKQYYNNLDFMIGIENNAPYSFDRNIAKCKYNKYKKYITNTLKKTPNILVKKPYTFYPAITSLIDKRFLGEDMYLMVLDCDTKENKNKAVDYLKKNKTEHFIIQSSPESYWIICNVIDSIPNIITLMRKIPGVDERYINCSERDGVMVLRGFPKPGLVPQFGDTSKLTEDTMFNHWILNFKAYWESQFIKDFADKQFIEAI